MLFNILPKLNLESVNINRKRLWTAGYAGNNTTQKYFNLGTRTLRDSFQPQIIASGSWKHGSLGFDHGAAITDNGNLFVWGRNTYGQLGLNTNSKTITLSQSPKVVGTSKWNQISTSSRVNSPLTLAIKSDGTLWGWGDNFYGQLGVGRKRESDNYTYTQSPVQVGNDSWSLISVGYRHVLGIKSTGTLWAWGENEHGQLGLGTVNFGIPYQDTVTGVWHQIPGSWKQVECGYGFWGGIKTDGTLWTWGSNQYPGALGHGDSYDRYTPTQVGHDDDWDFLTLGGDCYYPSICLALKKNGTLWGWGNNEVGSLGLGDYEPRSTPTQIGNQRWKQVSAGYDHCLGITYDGSLWAWGQSFEGQLGLMVGRSEDVNVPKLVSSDSWVFCHAGFYMTYGIRKDGTVWSCGEDFGGFLSGAGWAYYNQESPTLCATASQGSFVFVNTVFAYTSSAAYLMEDGSLYQSGCYDGRYSSRGLLAGSHGYQAVPFITQVDDSKSWSFVDCGYMGSYGTTKEGDLFFWGNNYYGNVGDNVYVGNRSGQTTINDYSVISPIFIGSGYVYAKQSKYAESSYNSSALALKKDGTLWALGYNTYGRDGNGDTRILSPTQVGTDSWSFVDANSSLYSSFGIKSDGSLWSWGANYYGYLGTGKNGGSVVPSKIGNDSWSMVSSGYDTTYGIKADKTLWAWGAGDFYINDLTEKGLIPFNFASSVIKKSPVVAAGGSWISISSGHNHYLGIKSGGTLWAWGSNDKGQLGLNDKINRSSPVQIGTNTWKKVYSYFSSSFAIRNDDTLWSWGFNNNGILGLGNYKLKSSPTQVGTDLWKELAVNGRYVLGLKTNGSLWAWGNNYDDYYNIGGLGLFEYDPQFKYDYRYDMYGQDRTLRFLTTSPLQIGKSSWISVSSGYVSGKASSFGIKLDGTLWAWGDGDTGVLTATTNSPIQVGSSWKKISCNSDHVIAIPHDGTSNDALWTWGSNTYGKLGQGNQIDKSSPVLISGSSYTPFYVSITDISSGSSHSVMRNRGLLFVWGNNYFGQLGLGDRNARSSPVQVSVTSYEKEYYNVYAFGDHTYSIRTDGSLWSWGANYWGSLGLGDTNHRSSPVQIGTSSWTSVSVNKHNCLGIKADGTLWAWGYNNSGQLGQSNLIHRSSPVQIGTSSWSVVSSGYLHSLAIKPDGSLWAWGYNNNGELGLGTRTNTSSPVQVGTSSWIFAFSGYNHNFAVRADNTLWAWGLNTWGQLGQSDTISRSSPVQVGTSLWSFITGGYRSAFGLTINNSLWAWGYNNKGQLGQGDQIHRSSPVQVGTNLFDNISWTTVSNYTSSGKKVLKSDGTLWTWGSTGFTKLNNYSWSFVSTNQEFIRTDGVVSDSDLAIWTDISSRFFHTVAIKSDGSLWAWGRNTDGQLGQGNTTFYSSPVQIGTSSWTSVSTGTNHTLAIRSDSTLWAWGSSSYGVLGQGNLTSYSSPVQIGTSLWSSVSGGDQHSLAIKPDGSLWAWGRNTLGILGLGDQVHRSSPVQVGTSLWSSVSGGTSHSSAIRSDGTLWIWGGNYIGHLGQGDRIHRSSPVQIGTSSWSQISSGDTQSFGIKLDGTLWAWGSNFFGELGQGDTIHRSSPVQIGTSSWSQISSGYKQTSAIRTDGTLWAWGFNDRGQLGQSNLINRSSPVQVGTSLWTSISAGYHNVAIRQDTTLWTWGNNINGQLGQNDLNHRSSPVQVGTESNLWSSIFTSIEEVYPEYGTGFNAYPYYRLSSLHPDPYGSRRIGIKKDGTLWTWRDTIDTQSFLDSQVSIRSPVMIGSSSWNFVATGDSDKFVMAIKVNGTLWAWGTNDSGQLGQGDTILRSSPVQIGTDTDWSSVAIDSNTPSVFAYKQNKTLWVWGKNTVGQLGLSDNDDRYSPVQVPGSWNVTNSGTNQSRYYRIKSNNDLESWNSNDIFSSDKEYFEPKLLEGSSWNTVHGGYKRTFAIKSNGTLWSWGENVIGQLGLGNTIYRSSPVQIGTSSWSSVSIGESYTLAIRLDNTLWAWGSNNFGELGNPSLDTSGVNVISQYTVIPKLVTDIPIKPRSNSWVAISAKNRNTFGILYDGSLWGWGQNTSGELGLLDKFDKSYPSSIGNLSWTSVSAGGYATGAIRSDGTLWTWGDNRDGQLGQGNLTSYSSPTQVGTQNDWSKIIGGPLTIGFMFAIKTNGTLWSWGDNSVGQLGLGDVVSQSSPVQVGGSWISVSTGYDSDTVAGIKSDGSLWAWGENNIGELGQNKPIVSIYTSPVPVGTSSWTIVEANSTFIFGIKNNGTLWSWGESGIYGLFGFNTRNDARKNPTQLGTNSWTSVSASRNHALAIRSDGTLWAWGSNSISFFGNGGLLGLGDGVHRSSPVQVGSALWNKVSAGYSHSVAISSDGSLWQWGDRIGYFSTASYQSPVQVGTFYDWNYISSGNGFSVAIKTDGSLWTWGNNYTGTLGQGQTNAVKYVSPVQLGTSLWTSVSCSGSHVVAIRSDNTLWTWGRNNYGQLGQGDTIHRSSPVQIGTSSWTSVSARAGHTAAIRSDNTLWTWGRNNYGQLGQGNLTSYSSPVQVGTDTNWKKAISGSRFIIMQKTNDTIFATGDAVSIAFYTEPTFDLQFALSPTQIGTSSWSYVNSGSNCHFAIRLDGSLWSWGYGGYLGLGDNFSRSSPTQIGTSSWSTVSSGNGFSLALKPDKTLWAWGYNGSGALGQGNLTYINSPVQIGTSSWNLIAAGSHAVAVRSDGTLWAWGPNFEGQLGTYAGVESPIQIGTSSWISVSSSEVGSVLAIKSDNTLWAWGYNNSGQLGQSDTIHRSSPVQIGTSSWSSVSAGSNATAAIKPDGTLWAWGYNNNGQLGQGDLVSRSSPVQVNAAYWSQVTTTFPFIWAANNIGVYGLKQDGTLWSWGNNTEGELGLGDFSFRSSPVQVGTSSWSQVSGGGYGCFALKADGTIWSWGSNFQEQLGLGKNRSQIDEVVFPTLIPGTSAFRYISGGDYYCLAIKTNNTLWAWGYNFGGALGLGDTNNRSSAVQVGTATNWSTVCGGNRFSGGIDSSGRLYTWGWNPYGQLGLGDINHRSIPTQIGSDTNWRFLAIRNAWHTAAIRTDGTLWTWGQNDYGQLGLGDRIYRSSPTQVGTQTDWSVVAVLGGDSSGSMMALKNNGTLWVWGHNFDGFSTATNSINNLMGLGLGDNIDRSSPTQLGTSSWSFISGGGYCTFYAIKPSRTLWAWGSNYYGALGQGTNSEYYNSSNTNSPVQIGIEPETWLSVHSANSSSGYFMIAQDSKGYLWAWGNTSAYASPGFFMSNQSRPRNVSEYFPSRSWSLITTSLSEQSLFIG